MDIDEEIKVLKDRIEVLEAEKKIKENGDENGDLIIGRPYWVCYNDKWFVSLYKGNGKFGETFDLRASRFGGCKLYAPLGLWAKRCDNGIVYLSKTKLDVETAKYHRSSSGLVCVNDSLDWLKPEHGAVRV